MPLGVTQTHKHTYRRMHTHTAHAHWRQPSPASRALKGGEVHHSTELWAVAQGEQCLHGRVLADALLIVQGAVPGQAQGSRPQVTRTGAAGVSPRGTKDCNQLPKGLWQRRDGGGRGGGRANHSRRVGVVGGGGGGWELARREHSLETTTTIRVTTTTHPLGLRLCGRQDRKSVV